MRECTFRRYQTFSRHCANTVDADSHIASRFDARDDCPPGVHGNLGTAFHGSGDTTSSLCHPPGNASGRENAASRTGLERTDRAPQRSDARRPPGLPSSRTSAPIPSTAAAPVASGATASAPPTSRGPWAAVSSRPAPSMAARFPLAPPGPPHGVSSAGDTVRRDRNNQTR
jgi:hypothetical protein